jgi:hypothetical protein
MKRKRIFYSILTGIILAMLAWVVVPGSPVLAASYELSVDSMRRDAVSYVYKDYGSGYFGNFSHDVAVTWTTDEGGAAYPMGGIWAVTNGTYTNQDMGDANDGMSVVANVYLPGPEARITLTDFTNDNSDYFAVASGKPWTRYLTITRSGTDLYCYIYTDSGRTVLEDTLHITCGVTTYQYLEAVHSRDSASSGDDWITYTVDDLDIGGGSLDFTSFTEIDSDGDITLVGSATDRYWVGGAGAWNSTSHWSQTSGGSSGATVPTSANDVYFDANSGLGAGGTLTVTNGGQNCRDISFSGVGEITWGTNYGINIYGDFSGIADLHIRGQINLYGNGYTWTHNGSDFYDVWIDTKAGSDYEVIDYIQADRGIDNSLGAVLDTISDSSYIQVGPGVGYNTSEFVPNSGGTYYEVRLYGGSSGASDTTYGQHTVTDAFTCTDLTFTNTHKNDYWVIYDDITVTGTLTFDGDAEDNRGKIVGYDDTQRTLTAATVVCDHFDFLYIIGAGAGDWDLSSAGEDTIDYNNNTGITFTYAYDDDEDIYWTGQQEGAGGSGYWADEYNWSNVSGGTGGMARHYLPTSLNDVYFDANSGFTIGNARVSIGGIVHGAGETVPGYCHDIDFTGSDAITAAELYFYNDGGSYGDMYLYGSVTLVSGMDTTAAGQVSDWYFLGSGNVDMAGVALCNGLQPTFNASGTYTLLDDLYIGDGTGDRCDWTYTAGTLDENGYSLVTTSDNSGIVTFTGGGYTYNGGVYFYDVGTVQIMGENTFDTFYCEAGAVLTDQLQFGADQYITDLYWYGHSTYQRLRVGSTTSGVQRQISVSNSVNVCNCDISDIAGVGAASWDISTCYNSDFGGNLGITFTTGAYIYWVGNSGSWSDNNNHWSYSSGGSPGARVPLIQDIAVFDSSSFTIPGRTVTIDIVNLSGIDTEDSLYTPVFSKAGQVDIYGDVLLGTCTWTVTSTYFKGTDTGLTSDSVLDTNVYVQKNPNFMSTLFMGSNIEIDGTIYVRSGTFDHNGWDLTVESYDSSTTTYDRTILLGEGTTTIDGTASGNAWYVQSSNLDFFCEDSTIKISNSGINGRTFYGAGLTYNNVQQAGAGVWTLTISGSNTFYELLIDRSAASKTLTGSVTCTISSLILEVEGTNTITITNTDFSMASGVVLGDYLILSGSSASGGASFFANVGGHSTDNGGNTGWIWTAPTAPTVVTLDATDATEAGATINGELTSLGNYAELYVYFEYGPTISYGYETDQQEMTEIGTFDDRLSPFHPYHFRAVVEFGFNDHAYGDDKTISLTGGVKQAKAAVSDPGEDPGDVLISSAPDEIPGMYDEGNTQGLLGLGPVIDPALDEADLDVEVFWYPIAFLVAIVVGFIAFAFTREMLIQALVSGMVMAAFCGGGVLGDGLLPYLTVVIFAIEALLIWIIQQKQTV